MQPRLPALQFDAWARAAELSIALLLILFAESYGAVRSCALRHGDSIDVNRELLALGFANVASGLFQGVPVGAGYSATYANESLGARSRLAGAAAAAGVVAALCFLRVGGAHSRAGAGRDRDLRHAPRGQPRAAAALSGWKRDRAVMVMAVGAVLCSACSMACSSRSRSAWRC